MNAPTSEDLIYQANRSTAPAYWMLDILWTVLVTSAQTQGRYSLIEQLMPQGAAPPPHVHAYGEEAFYLFHGDITYNAGGQTLSASDGAFVLIPRNTVHSFKVESETAHVLNLYAPGGFEQVFPALARPAETRTLPPPGLDPHESPKVIQFLTNYWGVPASLSFAQQEYGRAEGAAAPPLNRAVLTPFVTRREEAPADSLGELSSLVLASEKQTAALFSLDEVFCPADTEAPVEAKSGQRGFYLLEGCIRLQGSGETVYASAGTFVALSPGAAVTLRPEGGPARLLWLSVPAD